LKVCYIYERYLIQCCDYGAAEFVDYVVGGIKYNDVTVQLACVYTCIQLYSGQPAGQSSVMVRHPRLTQKLVHDVVHLLNHTNNNALISSLVGQCTGWPQKIGTISLYALTLPSIKRFSKLFHCQNRRKFVIIMSLKIPPHLKCVATLPCEMSSLYLISNN